MSDRIQQGVSALEQMQVPGTWSDVLERVTTLEAGADAAPVTDVAAVEVPTAASGAGLDEPGVRRRSRRRTATLVAAAAAIVGALAVLLVNVDVEGDSVNVATPSSTLGPTSSLPAPPPVDAPEATITARLAVSSPYVAAVGEEAVWVASTDRDEVVRIDPRTNRIVASVPVEASPTGVAIGAGAVWVASRETGLVLRIDPARNEVVATIVVGESPVWVTTAAGAVWVANNGDNTVSRIDPTSDTVVATIDVAGGPAVVAAGAGAVWVGHGGLVTRIDPSTNAIADEVEIGVGVTVGAGAVWVSDGSANVLRINPSTGEIVDSIPVGGLPIGLEVGAGGVWVNVSRNCKTGCEGSVVRIDPQRGSVVDVVELPAGFVGVPIAVGPDSVWTSDPGDERGLVRIDVELDP
ncbi:MAG: Vgb family protein [Acidimicrobiales bacterium]